MNKAEVQLRLWRDSDVSELVNLADNRRIADQLRDSFPHPYTRADARWWVEFANSQHPTTHFAIEWNGMLVGGIGYIPGRDIERVSCEVGYWIGEPFWGQGLATSALLSLIRLIESEGGVTRLFALPFAENKASCQVLQNAGFRLDAVLHRSAIKNGRILDQALYSLVLAEPQKDTASIE